MQDLIVRGSFDASSLPKVLNQIRSIALTGPKPDFAEHEQVYGPPAEFKGSVRLRRPLGQPVPKQDVGRWASYTLKYNGTPDPRSPDNCLKRTTMEITLDGDPTPFMATIDWTLRFELIRRGYRFHTRSGLRIELYCLEKLLKPGEVESAQQFVGPPLDGVPMDDDEQVQWIVEVCKTLAPSAAVETEELVSIVRFLDPDVALVSHPKK